MNKNDIDIEATREMAEYGCTVSLLPYQLLALLDEAARLREERDAAREEAEGLRNLVDFFRSPDDSDCWCQPGEPDGYHSERCTQVAVTLETLAPDSKEGA